ncbi:P-type ATPase [Natronococcus amylolyticus]|nr:hypothetical protein [Natronococcus amylolyticus]
MPDTAERITEGGETGTVPTANLEEDDLVLVRPGSNVPADGVVEDGESNDLWDVARLARLSRRSYRKMQEIIAWAAGYNVFALPLAAGVLAPISILLSPAVGAVLMSASTVIVAINAQLFRRPELVL